MKWHKFKSRFSWPNIATAFFALIALIGVIPYENPHFGDIFPPKIKPWIAPVCGLCAFVSRLYKAKKEPNVRRGRRFRSYSVKRRKKLA